MKFNSIPATLAVAAASAFAAFSVSAGALDEPLVTPAPVAPIVMTPVGLFAGGYGGIAVGYGWADNSVNNANAASPGVSQNGEGWLGGLYAGYRANFGQFVLGGEGSYDFADISSSNNNAKIDGLGRLKVIGGYDLGQTLIYAAAGAAYADGSVNSRSHADWGWLAGAGLDYMVTDNWSIGAEVLYQDFGRFGNSNTDVNLTTAQVKASYNF